MRAACRRCIRLHQDEAEAGGCRKGEVDQEVFEGEDVGLDGLKDRDLLDAPDISDLPVALGTIRVCVMATDANGPHGDRGGDADLPVEDRARDLHDRLFGPLAQGRDGVLLEAVEGVGLTSVERQVRDEAVFYRAVMRADELAQLDGQRRGNGNGA